MPATRERRLAVERRYRANMGAEKLARFYKNQHLRKYGLTLEQYEALLRKQNGQCAICGSFSANRRGHRMYVDHDHVTGQVRGLLCSKCNITLERFEAIPEFAAKVEGYLAAPREVN